MTENAIRSKSYNFALSIIQFARKMPKTREGDIIIHQLLRCSLSVGANVEEAIAGISKKDFTNKMGIALKEARESNYWLRLIRDSSILKNDLMTGLINNSDEIIRILTSIVKSAQSS